jgi:hypothetical protein
MIDAVTTTVSKPASARLSRQSMLADREAEALACSIAKGELMSNTEPEHYAKHWLEFPNGIPVESWGRDHLSTLLYAETRAVDHGGVIFETDPHMRVSRGYPTRLHNGVTVEGHTDFDCLLDAQAAGMLTYTAETVKFTPKGWKFVHNLRRKRAEGKS